MCGECVGSVWGVCGECVGSVFLPVLCAYVCLVNPWCSCTVESLDELSDMVVELFSQICNKDIPVPIVTEMPFSADELQVCVCTYIRM